MKESNFTLSNQQMKQTIQSLLCLDHGEVFRL